MAERLTHERCNGIKNGYWSPAKRQELVDKLAEFENLKKLPAEICDNYCRYPRSNMVRTASRINAGPVRSMIWQRCWIDEN